MSDHLPHDPHTTWPAPAATRTRRWAEDPATRVVATRQNRARGELAELLDFLSFIWDSTRHFVDSVFSFLGLRRAAPPPPLTPQQRALTRIRRAKTSLSNHEVRRANAVGVPLEYRPRASAQRRRSAGGTRVRFNADSLQVDRERSTLSRYSGLEDSLSTSPSRSESALSIGHRGSESERDGEKDVDRVLSKNALLPDSVWSSAVSKKGTPRVEAKFAQVKRAKTMVEEGMVAEGDEHVEVSLDAPTGVQDLLVRRMPESPPPGTPPTPPDLGQPELGSPGSIVTDGSASGDTSGDTVERSRGVKTKKLVGILRSPTRNLSKRSSKPRIAREAP